jgi:plasmid stabilization system protein ParE
VTAILLVQPEAEVDLAESFRWYEARQEGLGHEFLEAVSSTFDRICEEPSRYPVVYRHARRALLRRFPYAVLYVPRGETVHVLAILHQRRNPRLTQNRIRAFKPER